jgi:cell division protein FtsQ
VTAGKRRWRLVRAGSEAVPPSVRRFMARARRRQVRSALPWAVICVLAAVLALVGWTLWSSSLLGVREVRVAGTELATPAQVRQVAAVTEGVPLLRVDLGAVAARVRGLAPVAGVRVHRAWPHALVIEVVERTGVAAVRDDDSYALVDSGGVIFHTVPERPAGLPVLSLAEGVSPDPATRAALTVLAALPEPVRVEVDKLTVAGPAGISLTLHDGRKLVWGDETDSALKATVAAALLADGEVAAAGQVIDVSAPNVVSIH